MIRFGAYIVLRKPPLMHGIPVHPWLYCFMIIIALYCFAGFHHWSGPPAARHGLETRCPSFTRRTSSGAGPSLFITPPSQSGGPISAAEKAAGLHLPSPAIPILEKIENPLL